MKARQQGVALITALLITAIATIAAVSMAARQHIDIRRSENVLNTNQAWLFAQGIEAWARHMLLRDAKDNQHDALNEDWATVLPPINVEGGVVAGQIIDLQGRLNVNNLIRDGEISQPDIERLQRLFNMLDVEVELVDAIADWLDSDEQVRFPNGAEDNVYLGRDIAYRSANRLMTSPSELLLVEGIDKEIYDTIEPYLTALPINTPVNVNTAPEQVLRVVVDGLSKAEAEQIVSDRDEQPFETLQAFKNHATVKNYLPNKQPDANNNDNDDKTNTPAETMTVATSYFLLQATSQYGRSQIELTSLFERQQDSIQTLSRSMGGY